MESVVFLARHGERHTIPPHLVNYRANIWALARVVGATGIIAVGSVGGIRADLAPGAVVAPNQILDYTHGRQHTYIESGEDAVVHVDFTNPYDLQIRSRLLMAASRCDEMAIDGATYATTQGPRLETAAEINRLQQDGADIVGMTGMPEASLARELGIPYAAVCVVANWAAGRSDSRDQVDLSRSEGALLGGLSRVRRILVALANEGARR